MTGEQQETLALWSDFCRTYGRRDEQKKDFERKYCESRSSPGFFGGRAPSADWLGGTRLWAGDGTVCQRSSELWAAVPGDEMRLWVMYEQRKVVVRRPDRVIVGLEVIPHVLAWGLVVPTVSLLSVARGYPTETRMYVWSRSWPHRDHACAILDEVRSSLVIPESLPSSSPLYLGRVS